MAVVDPAPHCMSNRALVLLTMVLAAVLLVTVVVALAVWHTPALQPVHVPSVGQA